MENGLMTVRELAAMLKVSSRQCWKLVSAGRLPQPVRLARSVRWRASDISEFIECGCDMRQFEADRRAVSG
jgi:excisionase family DNA binding protein